MFCSWIRTCFNQVSESCFYTISIIFDSRLLFIILHLVLIIYSQLSIDLVSVIIFHYLIDSRFSIKLIQSIWFISIGQNYDIDLILSHVLAIDDSVDWWRLKYGSYWLIDGANESMKLWRTRWLTDEDGHEFVWKRCFWSENL